MRCGKLVKMAFIEDRQTDRNTQYDDTVNSFLYKLKALYNKYVKTSK